MGVCIGLVDLTAVVFAASAIAGTLALGAAAWIEHTSYHALLPIALFVSGGIFGDFVQDKLGEKSANYVLGIVAAAVTTLGTIITILLK
jgi:hypothetical protein